MIPTIRLYYEDAYISEFMATVLSVEATKDGIYKVILDRTAFFPESGGQYADTGLLAGSEVVDVKIKDEIITHFVKFDSDPSSLIGSKIPCLLDFDHRYSNMQQHTGEHIFSGIVRRHYGYENTGFHLSDNIVTMDYDGKLSDEDLQKLERLTNEAIFENHPIRAYFPAPEELEKLDYRSKLEASEMGNVRIVEIEDVDICACCAPHVKATGEVGILKILSCDSHKSGVRISILCGMRALLDYNKKQEILLSLSRNLSVPPEQLPEALIKLQNDAEDVKLYIRSLETKLLQSETERTDASCPVIFCEVSDSILLRNTVNSLSEGSDEYVLAFNGNDDKGYSFIISAKKDDARNLMHRLSEIINLKGGGSPKMVQGQTREHRDAIESAIKRLF